MKMSRIVRFIAMVTVVYGCCVFAKVPYKPSWNSLSAYDVPEWFKDAKFGIYTHWGPYSVPGCGPNGCWYPHNMYIEATEPQRVDKLVKLARNWQYAPELTLEGDGYHYDDYQIKEKAYILRRGSGGKDLRLSIKAGPERPLVNPAFVIKGIKYEPSKLMINDSEFSNYRAGFEGNDLVVWVPFTSMKNTLVELIF